MTSIIDYEHLNAMLFVEPTAIVEHIPDKLPDRALVRDRPFKPHSNAIAPPGFYLTKDT